MPAKKTTKKVAAKKTAVKEAPGKKAAVKKAAAKKVVAKKVVAKKTPAKKKAVPSIEAVAKAAYLNYCRRVEEGMPGCHDSDWLEAERSLGI